MFILFNWINFENEQIYAEQSKQFESMHFEYNYLNKIKNKNNFFFECRNLTCFIYDVQICITLS